MANKSFIYREQQRKFALLSQLPKAITDNLFFLPQFLGESTSEILSVAIKARSRALGPFHPSFDVNRIIYESLVKTLPDDAHLKANGRLSISVTRISDGKNVIINKFKSKEELIKVSHMSHTLSFCWSFSRSVSLHY